MKTQKTFNTPTSIKSGIMSLKRTRTVIKQNEERIKEIKEDGLTYIGEFNTADCASLSEVISKASTLLTQQGDVKFFNRWCSRPSYRYPATTEQTAGVLKKLENEIAEWKEREQFLEAYLEGKVGDIQTVITKKKRLEMA
jgi:hypothetical protein